MKLAALLLLLWASVHYGYKLAPADLQGAWFNVARSASSLVLLGLVLMAMPHRAALVIGAGLAAEDAQVVGCGLWWLVDSWPPGGELCSERIGLPLGAFGLAALGTAAWWLRKKGGDHDGPAA